MLTPVTVLGPSNRGPQMESDAERAAWNKLNRLMLSGRDFQQALSAATFLIEESDEARGLAGLRRLRCFETNMVVSYARPFSQAYGDVRPLKLSDLDLEMKKGWQDMHERLVRLRNKLFAHSDADAVPMSVTVLNAIMGDGRPDFPFVMPRFDEHLTFTDEEVWLIQDICRQALHATLEKTQTLGIDFRDRFHVHDIDMSIRSD